MFGWDDTDFLIGDAARVMPQMDARLTEGGFGLAAGTKVATQLGWRSVEAVAEGDQVLTFDRGLQTVVAVSRRTVWADAALMDPDSWPLHVPAGALGNRGDMMLLPGQTVMIESDAAEEAYGDPFALIPAAALDGFRGIERVVPDARFEVVTLHFAQDEIIFANIGALFHCPRNVDLVADAMTARVDSYPVLGLEAAETLVTLMEMDDQAGTTMPEITDIAMAARPAA